MVVYEDYATGNVHYVDNNRLPITKDPYKDKPGHGWIIDGYCTTKKSSSPNSDLYWYNG